MKLSVQTLGTVDIIGIDAGFAAISAAGFDAVDFGLDGFYKWDDLTSGKKCDFYKDENLYRYVDEVKSAAEKYGVEFGQMHAPFPLFVPKSPEGSKNVQDDVRKCIEVCSYVGCPRIVIHPIFDGSARFPSMTKEQEYKANMEFYTSIIPLLKKHKVVCCLENMWSQDWKTKKVYTAVCSDINETIRYIDELNAIAGERLFGFCLDIGHLLLLGQDPCYWIEQLGDRLETLHTHDNDGVNDEHIIPYMGCANWERFVLGLRKIGYKGNLSFEVSSFNRKFPKELVPAALNITGSIGKYLAGRITAESDPTDGNR
ncbi:MAG: sugar phosphate isomerase/epimerase [Clostridia bacterium]|nr:sugar phosphate isomerase/epimerase [Clostridia bacterium]